MSAGVLYWVFLNLNVICCYQYTIVADTVPVAQAPAYRRASTQTAPRRSATTVAMSFHDLSAKDIDGNDVAFSKFKGKVVLVTNVASR